MPNPSDAEEHLRVIRSLMERATHYRAISAQGALVGGLLSVLTAGLLIWRESRGHGCERCELVSWLVVLALTAAANLWFLWRDERARGEPFFSSRTRWALRALAPSFVTAGAVTLVLGDRVLLLLGVLWSAFYGIGLLATGHFAPKSINRLGRAFVAVALLAVVSEPLWGNMAGSGNPRAFEFYMAATFGLFHLVYAALTWPRRAAAHEAVEDPAHVRL